MIKLDTLSQILGYSGIIGGVVGIACIGIFTFALYLFNNYPEVLLRDRAIEVLKKIRSSELTEEALRSLIDNNYDEIFTPTEVADFIKTDSFMQFKKHYFNKNLDAEIMDEILLASSEPGICIWLLGTKFHLKQYRKDEWIIVTPHIEKMMARDFNRTIKNTTEKEK